MYPFLLCKQLYSVRQERGSISFIPGGNDALLLSNVILRNACNNSNHSQEERYFSGLCFEWPNFYMLKGTVIRKYLAVAFIK